MDSAPRASPCMRSDAGSPSPRRCGNRDRPARLFLLQYLDLHLCTLCFFPGQGETRRNKDDPYSARILTEATRRLPIIASALVNRQGQQKEMFVKHYEACPAKTCTEYVGPGCCFRPSGGVDEAPHHWDLKGVDYQRISCIVMAFVGSDRQCRRGSPTRAG
jgi:hypothetical protein